MIKPTAKERILEASLKLFANKGFELTTIKEIASAANVNEVTIFRLFKSKGELFNTVYREFTPSHLSPEKISDRFTGVIRHDLKIIASNYIDQSLKNQDYIRMTFFEALHNTEMAPTISRIPETLYNTLREYLEDIHSKGKISQSNFHMVSKMFYNILFQYVLTQGTEFNKESSVEYQMELIDSCVDLFASALEIK